MSRKKHASMQCHMQLIQLLSLTIIQIIGKPLISFETVNQNTQRKQIARTCYAITIRYRNIIDL